MSVDWGGRGGRDARSCAVGGPLDTLQPQPKPLPQRGHLTLPLAPMCCHCSGTYMQVEQLAQRRFEGMQVIGTSYPIPGWKVRCSSRSLRQATPAVTLSA